MPRKFDLNERLIEFASQIIDIAENLPRAITGNHIANQLIRSGTSPALHQVKHRALNHEVILSTK